VTSSLFYFPVTKTRSPYYNLAIEETISLNLVKHGLMGGIRIWENPPTIVLGLSEDPKKTVQPQVLEKFQTLASNQVFTKFSHPNFLYIARRASGGGTVYQEPVSNINYSIYVNLEKRQDLFSVKDSYSLLLGLVTRALGEQSIEAHSNGKSDITVSEGGVLKKISGNAQFRKKNCIVQHGTLILKEELIEKVSSILLHPPEEPEYRKARAHRDFLTSLPSSFHAEKFGERLFQEFLTFLQIENQTNTKENSIFSRGFSSFLRSVLKESEIIRKRKYEQLSYILNREIPT
jgi:lipoate-protein ligase A